MIHTGGVSSLDLCAQVWEEGKARGCGVVMLVVFFVAKTSLEELISLCDTRSCVTQAAERPESGFKVNTGLSVMGHWDQVEAERGK